MKLFILAEEVLDELHGISLDARVWAPVLRNAIKISKNTKNPIITGKDYPKEYNAFPIDYIHFNVDERYGNGAGYDEKKSGYQGNEYHAYFLFGPYANDSSINHELRHAFEDFKKISKGHPAMQYGKEAINLFSGDFERLMISHSSREYLRPVSTLIEGLYYTSKIERSGFAETVFDNAARTEIISTIKQLVQYANISKIYYEYPPEKIEKKWKEFKEIFHIPVTDKFKNYGDFIKWACDEINYKGNITLKKLRKVKYNSIQIKKEGGK
jgi:hypothetical protein